MLNSDNLHSEDETHCVMVTESTRLQSHFEAFCIQPTSAWALQLKPLLYGTYLVYKGYPKIIH